MLEQKKFDLEERNLQKEAKETRYWIRMIARAIPELKIQSEPLWQEANEL